MPTSMPAPSPESAAAGAVSPNSVQGQSTVTVRPAPGVSMLPLSSVARVRIVVDGEPWATHEYDQAVVPVAGCQVAPPSVEISMPPTTPPMSEAVPLMVTLVPSATVVGALVMVDVGLVVSVDLVTAMMS